MAEKLGLTGELRPLKIGQSFTNPKSTAFHSIKYDFKPASVDTNKIATVDVGNNHQVTVTVPHLDGAGLPQTVFKGSQRPHQKECVLIIDKVTGEITLEKLACNIQVKKTRNESVRSQLPQQGSGTAAGGGGTSNTSNNNNNSNSDRLTSSQQQRSQTPPVGGGQRISHKTKVTSGSRRADRQITHLVPKHSPLHASPSYPSPGHLRSPKRDLIHTNNNNNNNDNNHNASTSQSTLASLPMIGLDDFPDPVPLLPPPPLPAVPPPPPTPLSQIPQQQQHQNILISANNNNNSNINNGSMTDNNFRLLDHDENGVGEISDSSSSGSSDSDSDSDPDNTVIDNFNSKTIIPTAAATTNGHGTVNGTTNSNNNTKISTHLLNEDLCLSESGSDSD